LPIFPGLAGDHDIRGTRPSSYVAVKSRLRIRMRARAPRRLPGRATPHSHEAQTSNGSVKGLWSALQTHLKGLNWATLAIVPEETHRAALLSRSSGVNLTRLAKEGKPKPSVRPNPKALTPHGCVELIRASGYAICQIGRSAGGSGYADGGRARRCDGGLPAWR